MKQKDKPVITLKVNSEGVKISKKPSDKPSNVVTEWAKFRATLPAKKEK